MEEDNWGECPECGNTVKLKNLKNHLKKVHSELSKEDINKVLRSQKSGAGSSGSSRAERRIGMEVERKKQFTMITVIVIIILSAVIIGGYLFFMASDSDNDTDEANEIKPEPAKNSPTDTNSEEIQVPVSEVNDGQAHFYTYDSDGVLVRYFLVKGSEGKIHSAADACEVCYDQKKGYKQSDDKDQMVCKNCQNQYPIDGLGPKTDPGCWPSHIPNKIEGNNVVIDTSDLDQINKYFK